MKHWLSLIGEKSQDLLGLVARAAEIKAGNKPKSIQGKTLAMFFFNQSLRTRMSFEAAMQRFGGHVISLSPGNDTWGFEFEEGQLMNGNKAEHIKDAVRVASRYVDAIGVRAFAELKDWQADASEKVLTSFAKYATCPVINMESAMEHPCQSMADMLTISEKLVSPRGKRFVLSWAPHIKPLPIAVPHSALLTAANLGMNITLACPKEYSLHPKYLAEVQAICKNQNSNFEISDQQLKHTTEADVLYVKSWGAPQFYNDSEAQTASFKNNSNWTIDSGHLGVKTILMHCLPVRRNLKISDKVLDSPNSVIIDQAENRLWAQAAILEKVFS